MATSALLPRLRRIWPLSKPYRYRLLAVGLLALSTTLATLALPLGMRALLDQALSSGYRRLLDWLALGLLALFVARALLGFLAQYLIRSVGEQVIADLRNLTYRHLHTLDFAYHTRHRASDLISRLASDTQALRGAATDIMISVVLGVFQLAGSVAIMVAMNWRLSAIVLSITPLAALLSRSFGVRLRRLARGVQERLAYCSTVAHEALSAVPVVQAFGRSGFEAERYAAALTRHLEGARGSARTSALFSAAVNLMFGASSVALFWFGGREVLAGRLTAGELVAFLFYSQNISQCVGLLSSQYATLSAAAGASERVFELLDARPRVVDAPGAVPLVVSEGRIRLEHVSFAYAPEALVLRDISFTVEPDEPVALVGSSGAGKTSLLQLIPRFYEPQIGRVLIDGQDVRHVGLASLRAQIAIVSQDGPLFAMSVRENIRYGRLDASDAEIEAAARDAHAHEFIMALPEGYDTQVGDRGVWLSGGQRQRLSIARALLKDARILILDEATSSVDPLSDAAVREAVDRLRVGRTTIRVTHRLASLRPGDRILVLEKGQIVEAGTEAQLLERGGRFHQLATAHLGASGLDSNPASRGLRAWAER
jgi:subfamily B ATP-binding cassette protein MsbA